jgi:hypothetical protein
LKDLKQRGLLEETLILWGGEFGRTPAVEMPKKGSNQGKINGRDHNHWGFTVSGWPAAACAAGPFTEPRTSSAFGRWKTAVHVHDLHATQSC